MDLLVSIGTIVKGDVVDLLASGFLIPDNVAVLAIDVTPALQSCISACISLLIRGLSKSYRLPMLIATITPMRSFLFKELLLIINHGSVARRMSIAPDQAK